MDGKVDQTEGEINVDVLGRGNIKYRLRSNKNVEEDIDGNETIADDRYIEKESFYKEQSILNVFQLNFQFKLLSNINQGT